MSMKKAEGIPPQMVKPQQAGILILIPGNAGVPDMTRDALSFKNVYRSEFWRVRVMMGAANVEDLKGVSDRVAELSRMGVAFIAFSAGRNTPLPEYEGDMTEFIDQSLRTDLVDGSGREQ